jgi:hypothetical protein
MWRGSSYLREAVSRSLQLVVGSGLFDVWPLIGLRHLCLRALFRTGKGLLVGSHCRFVRPHGSCDAVASLLIGDDVKINHSVEIDYSGGVRIGDRVWLSQEVLIETHQHAIGAGRKESWPLERGPLEIGDDAWLGARAVILPQVRCIGSGAIVGTGAIVTRDVPPLAVVAGNPARVIRVRDR